MKKALICFGLLAVTLFACKKLSQLLTFEISNTENITIPASGILNVPIISPVPVTMNSQESFENNNTSASLVKDVILKKLTLAITDPANENFNFLKSIKLYIGTDEYDKVPLASLVDTFFVILKFEKRGSRRTQRKHYEHEKFNNFVKTA